eukprot:TRINITY_DN99015_c0_g1_i1.p1 TRINITY_DN99015_c0_g1~~TRINITY_DN99015_c0_g1_i1.p1  ORF type:complete len:154 (+),score=22.57 TRINITY_DN99015_c0_g1_i1:38-499(+)
MSLRMIFLSLLFLYSDCSSCLGEIVELTSDTDAPQPGIDAHVLDITLGRGAGGVMIDLHYKSASGSDQGEPSWQHISTRTTEASGRTDSFTTSLQAGVYRMTYKVEDYFLSSKRESFYPEVVVHFRVKESQLKQNFHIPITLSEFGYSTYRGV